MVVLLFQNNMKEEYPFTISVSWLCIVYKTHFSVPLTKLRFALFVLFECNKLEEKAKTMFRNTFQSGFLSILYSIG